MQLCIESPWYGFDDTEPELAVNGAGSEPTTKCISDSRRLQPGAAEPKCAGCMGQQEDCVESVRPRSVRRAKVALPSTVLLESSRLGRAESGKFLERTSMVGNGSTGEQGPNLTVDRFQAANALAGPDITACAVFSQTVYPHQTHRFRPRVYLWPGVS